MARRVTLKDIAQATGFHVSTVSRALDLKSRINLTEEAVKQIRDAANEMGYRPNRIAAGLRTNRTMTVGVVIPDITNALFPPIVRGIESVLEPEGYASIIVNTDNLPERENHLVDVLAERGVDGILHAATLRRDDSIIALKGEGMPVVTLNRSTEDADIPCVISDDKAGIRMTLEHLYGLGHRRIAHIAGPQALSTGFERREAFEESRNALGLSDDETPTVVAERFDDNSGRRCAEELFAGKGAFTAVLCANDRLAIGAIAALRDKGLLCPRDVSVTGFNDLPLLDLLEPRLTTVKIRQFEAGEAAARYLMAMLRGTKPEGDGRTVLPVELIVRGSAAAPGG